MDKNIFFKLATKFLLFSSSLWVRKMMVPQMNIMCKHEDICPCTILSANDLMLSISDIVMPKYTHKYFGVSAQRLIYYYMSSPWKCLVSYRLQMSYQPLRYILPVNPLITIISTEIWTNILESDRGKGNATCIQSNFLTICQNKLHNQKTIAQIERFRFINTAWLKHYKL